jgi:RsiW-degrading membrane proteinase PrsW (M82 family)
MTGQPHPPSFTIPPPATPRPAARTWPLWSVYVVAVLSGSVILVSRLAPSVAETPTLTAVGIVAFGFFGAFCIWLLSKINYFRTPGPRTVALAILWGGFAAIGYALLANTAIYRYFAEQDAAGSWALFAPLTEDPAKDIGIVIVLLLAATQPRSALDGLVAGAFVGLGFELTESLTRAINNAIAFYPAGRRDNLGSLTSDVIHEVIRNSWTGHIVLTGIAGFGIGYLLTARDRSMARRGAVAVALIILAAGGHWLWNSHRFGVFYVLGQFSLLAVFLGLIRVGRTLEARVYLPYLAYAPTQVDAETTATLSRRQIKARRRASAVLAAAIANGDAQRAHESAESLAAGVGG